MAHIHNLLYKFQMPQHLQIPPKRTGAIDAFQKTFRPKFQQIRKQIKKVNFKNLPKRVNGRFKPWQG